VVVFATGVLSEPIMPTIAQGNLTEPRNRNQIAGDKIPSGTNSELASRKNSVTFSGIASSPD